MRATQGPSNRQVDEKVMLHAIERYSDTHTKNERLPFVIAWMDPEGFMLSEISQRKTNTT